MLRLMRSPRLEMLGWWRRQRGWRTRGWRRLLRERWWGPECGGCTSTRGMPRPGRTLLEPAQWRAAISLKQEG